jgi:serine/threonine-protein kinase HipA
MKLIIYTAQHKVGELSYNSSEETFSFSYANEWKENGYALSPYLKVDSNAQSASIKRFFANLLPEGKGLEELSNYFQISKSNIFGLIEKLSYDTAGALFFSSNETLNMTTSFRSISKEELSVRILERTHQSITIWDGKPRLSLAGIQDKLPIIYVNDKFGLGEGNLCSTHILKFDTIANHHTVLNEFYSMRLAKSVGLNVADVELLRFQNEAVLLVKRFDRIYHSDSYVERLHIIDGCQMLDLSPSEKYERPYGSQRDVAHFRSGANFTKLFELSKFCSIPALATQHILRWTIFNLITSNYDAHAKNISFFVQKGKIDPAPFYDLLNVSLYPQFAQEYSMAFGDTFNPDDISPYDLAEFCHLCSIKPKLFIQEFTKIATLLRSTFDNNFIYEFCIDENEKTFATYYMESIKMRTTKIELFMEDITIVYKSHFS